MENNVDTQPDLPMKWHNFLIYFALWAGGILNGISGFRAISGTQYGADAGRVYSYYPGLKTIDVIFGAFVIFIAIFTIVTRFKLAGFRKDGPTCLFLVYILNAVGSVFYILAVVSTTSLSLDTFGAQLVGQIVGSIILVCANKVYYNNRAYMFVY